MSCLAAAKYSKKKGIPQILVKNDLFFVYFQKVVILIGSQQISVISWWSVLLLEKNTDKLYHIMLYQVHLPTSRIRNHNFSGDRN
jgi:hypothetical protein